MNLKNIAKLLASYIARNLKESNSNKKNPKLNSRDNKTKTENFSDQTFSSENPIPHFDEARSKSLHLIASNYNWDGGYQQLWDIIKNRHCDKGTALLIYWLSTPGYYCQFESRNQVPNFQLESYDFVTYLERSLLNGDFAVSKILFNPQWDRTTISKKGYDWTSEYKEQRVNKDIPEILKQPSKIDPEWEDFKSQHK